MATVPSQYPHAHPVKTEWHDPRAMLHHTNTGPRQVGRYQETAHGLFVSRMFDGHPRIRHWQAHLLPAHSLVVCKYEFHGEREHDFYIDVARISRRYDLWTVRDLYLDVLVWNGVGAQIVDTHELLDSRRAGHISEEEMHHAVEVAHRTLAELTRALYCLGDWAQGLGLDWMDTPAP